MKKLFSICLICIIPMLLCCSCGLFGDKKYYCDVDEVESVQIVRLDGYVEEEYRFEYTVLSEVSDYETFVKRLNNVEHSVNWGDPGVLRLQYIVIKIDYHNGDFDLLYPNAQRFHRSGKNQYGFFFFDKEQFNDLISDYLTE